MSYYPELVNDINNKFKVVLDLSNHAKFNSNYQTKKKKLKDATRNFITFKAKIYQLDINKLVIVQRSLNNVKTKIDDLENDKLKTVFENLKR